MIKTMVFVVRRDFFAQKNVRTAFLKICLNKLCKKFVEIKIIT